MEQAENADTVNVAKVGRMNILCDCLAEGTNILKPDGTTRPIESIRNGDSVMGENGQFVTVSNTVAGVEYEPLVVICTAKTHKLSCSAAHPVMTTKGMVKAVDLCNDSKLFGEWGEELSIDCILKDVGEHNVYNLEVDGGHFYAEGVLVGDFKVQWEVDKPQDAIELAEIKSYFAEYKTIPEFWKQN